MKRALFPLETSAAALCLLAMPLAAAPAGRLEICPQHPYFFRDGERHVALVGVSDRSLLHIWENEKGFLWRRCIEDLAAHGLDYMRVDVCTWGGLRDAVRYPAQLSKPAWPFARTGPGVAVDGKPRFDLTRFDPDFFRERLRPFLCETARRGIYVELTLFDDPRGRRFADSLWSDAGNANGLGLRPGLATSDEALGRPRLLAIEEAYVDRVLVETAEFGHVIYEVANETGGRRWVAHIADFIHGRRCGRGRLVSAGEQSSSFDPLTGPNDIVIKHRGARHRGGGGPYAGDAGVRRHHDALLALRAGKPVIHNEYFLFVNGSTSDVDFPRKMMWGDLLAGGHSNLYDFSFRRGTGRTLSDGRRSRSPPEEILRGGQILLEFLARGEVPFWEMEPHDELARVEGGGDAIVFTLARPGADHVSYVLGDGPLTLALDLPREPFVARWFDPRTGRFMTPRRAIPGGKRCRIRSPAFEGDAVLRVRRER